MRIFEESFSLPVAPSHRALLSHLQRAVAFRISPGLFPCRLAVTGTSTDHYECELAVVDGDVNVGRQAPTGIFEFTLRKAENTDKFSVVLLVPTGIGSEIGGHAGDAGPVARVMARVCDHLVTHPNVVNASDINEIPENALYVEGSVLSRLLMGTVGLQPVRSNRVLVVMDAHKSEALANGAINAVNAARAAYGFQCPKVVMLDPPLRMTSIYNGSGRSSGDIQGIDALMELLRDERASFDAVAVSSVIEVPPNFHQEYFDCGGTMINPWGGVEALLTHAISSIHNVPSAHSPMFESEEIANADPGIVEPRMAAEAISLTFLQCILKGLHRSPRIITDRQEMDARDIVTVRDISCLVMPDGCVGLPTLAALEQGIPVIAVRENRNIMRNDLTALPWGAGQLHIVDNYWEAVGILAALKAGVAPESMRRPLRYVPVEVRRATHALEEERLKRDTAT